MVYLETDKVIFEKLSVHLPELFPNINFKLIYADETLEKLGLARSAPCLICLDLSPDEYDELLDDLLQLEIDACNTPKYPPAENDPAYIRYKKYCWMYGVFANAEIRFE